MLKRIRIRGYKSFHDENVRLEPVAVLFGANAAGKGNFLEVLQLLARLGTTETISDAFKFPYRGIPVEAFSLGEGGIPELLARSRLTFSIEADIELSEIAVTEAERRIEEVHSSSGCRTSAFGVRERNLRYRVKVEMRPATGAWRIADEHLVALNRDGNPKQGRHPFIAWERGWALLRREKPGSFIRFDRNLDHTLLSARHYPPHCPHLTAARAELEHWKFFRLNSDYMRASGGLMEARDIGGQGEHLASFLHTLRLSEPGQFRAVEAALRMLVPGMNGIETFVNDERKVEFRVMQNGVPVSARVLSGGALHFLGLLATAGTGGGAPSLMGIEVLENEVYPRHMRLLADLLKTRAFLGSQCVVVTHSTLLSDLLPEKYLFAVRRHGRSDRRTRIDSAANWGPLGYDPKLPDRSPLLPVSERILRGDFD